MSSTVTNTVVNIFKKVYGQAHDLVPKSDVVDDLLPFKAGAASGEEFVEDFILGDEVGATWAGQAQRAFDIKQGIAGAVEQSLVKPTQFMLETILAYAFASRSAQGGEEAFFNGTKNRMKNHLSSHAKLRAIEKLYGQSAEGLGSVSFAPAGTIYRATPYSGAGDITLTRKDETTIAFVDGINVAEKAILFQPGQFAAGFYVGKRGIVLKQVETATGLVVASGKLSTVDASLGVIYVDFTPVAATAVNSHIIVYDEWENGMCMVGVEKIIKNNGLLFGIDARKFDLWKGQRLSLKNQKFNLKAVQVAVADAVNAGGLEDSLDILVNPITFGQMSADEASLRKYDASYKSSAASNGFESIEYFAANGVNRIRASNKVKEGHAFGLIKGDWLCSGSQAPSFNVTGMQEEVIFPLERQAGFVVRSFSDMFAICRKPACQIIWTDCNPEGSDY